MPHLSPQKRSLRLHLRPVSGAYSADSSRKNDPVEVNDKLTMVRISKPSATSRRREAVPGKSTGIGAAKRPAASNTSVKRGTVGGSALSASAPRRTVAAGSSSPRGLVPLMPTSIDRSVETNPQRIGLQGTVEGVTTMRAIKGHTPSLINGDSIHAGGAAAPDLAAIGLDRKSVV